MGNALIKYKGITFAIARGIPRRGKKIRKHSISNKFIRIDKGV